MVHRLPPVRIAMEAGAHSISISEQLRELGHEVIVANVRELRAISHSDRKSDQVDAEKLARYARVDGRSFGPSLTGRLSSRKPSLDRRTRFARPTTNRGGERSARTDEGLRSSYAGFLHEVLRQAERCRDAAWTSAGTWSGA